MPTLSDEEICSKCVEISKSLTNTSIGVVGIDLKNSRKIGDSARLAASIRRAGEITPHNFDAVATTLKIDARIAEDSILKDFEELGWVEIKRDGRKIERIDEFIPPTTNLLGSLGKLWKEYGPTTIDEASVSSLNLLGKRPHTKEALLSELGINEKDLDATINYGEQVNYMGRITSSELRQELVWAPFYWNNNIRCCNE